MAKLLFESFAVLFFVFFFIAAASCLGFFFGLGFVKAIEHEKLSIPLIVKPPGDKGGE